MVFKVFVMFSMVVMYFWFRVVFCWSCFFLMINLFWCIFVLSFNVLWCFFVFIFNSNLWWVFLWFCIMNMELMFKFFFWLFVMVENVFLEVLVESWCCLVKWGLFELFILFFCIGWCFFEVGVLFVRFFRYMWERIY